MNKRELIKHIEDLPYKEGLIVDKIDISRKGLLELVKQLDEPGKVTIPQFVANWIEVCKEHLTSSLYLAMTPSFLKSNNQGIELTLWIKKNEETFARAWLDGYEVEKEKRYLVKVKGVNEECECLFFGELSNTWKFRSLGSFGELKKHHTRKELEEAGFGWVFDCPGIEIEGVDD